MKNITYKEFLKKINNIRDDKLYLKSETLKCCSCSNYDDELRGCILDEDECYCTFYNEECDSYEPRENEDSSKEESESSDFFKNIISKTLQSFVNDKNMVGMQKMTLPSGRIFTSHPIENIKEEDNTKLQEENFKNEIKVLKGQNERLKSLLKYFIDNYI